MRTRVGCYLGLGHKRRTGGCLRGVSRVGEGGWG